MSVKESHNTLIGNNHFYCSQGAERWIEKTTFVIYIIISLYHYTSIPVGTKCAGKIPLRERIIRYGKACHPVFTLHHWLEYNTKSHLLFT